MKSLVIFTLVIAVAGILTSLAGCMAEKRSKERAIKRAEVAERRAQARDAMFYAQEAQYDRDAIEAWKHVQELRASKAQGWEISE